MPNKNQLQNPVILTRSNHKLALLLLIISLINVITTIDALIRTAKKKLIKSKFGVQGPDLKFPENLITQTTSIAII